MSPWLNTLSPKVRLFLKKKLRKVDLSRNLQHTEGLEQAKAFWAEIKAQHPNARHHCWAAVAGKPTDSQQLGFSDDGEPAGTAGKPMLSALQGSQVGEISAVVVRYYGGIYRHGGISSCLWKWCATSFKIIRN